MHPFADVVGAAHLFRLIREPIQAQADKHISYSVPARFPPLAGNSPVTPAGQTCPGCVDETRTRGLFYPLIALSRAQPAVQARSRRLDAQSGRRRKQHRRHFAGQGADKLRMAVLRRATAELVCLGQ